MQRVGAHESLFEALTLIEVQVALVAAREGQWGRDSCSCPVFRC